MGPADCKAALTSMATELFISSLCSCRISSGESLLLIGISSSILPWLAMLILRTPSPGESAGLVAEALSCRWLMDL